MMTRSDYLDKAVSKIGEGRAFDIELVLEHLVRLEDNDGDARRLSAEERTLLVVADQELGTWMVRAWKRFLWDRYRAAYVGW